MTSSLHRHPYTQAFLFQWPRPGSGSVVVVVVVFSQHFLLARAIRSACRCFFLCYQSVEEATGPTALCGIRTTPRIEILSPEIQPSDPLVE